MECMGLGRCRFHLWNVVSVHELLRKLPASPNSAACFLIWVVAGPTKHVRQLRIPFHQYAAEFRWRANSRLLHHGSRFAHADSSLAFLWSATG